MAATWPVTLPDLCEVVDLRETRIANYVEERPLVGGGERRRTATRSLRSFSNVTLIPLTKDQCATFWSFYENDVLDGTEQFDIDHPDTSVGTLRCMFSGDPPRQERLGPNRYSISFDLEEK